MKTYILLALIFLPLLSAEAQELGAQQPLVSDFTGAYTGSESDPPEIIKKKAKQDALSQAAEYGGVFIRQTTKVDKAIVTDDLVEMASASSVRILSIEYEGPVIVPGAGGRTYRCKIKAEVSPTTGEETLRKMLDEMKSGKYDTVIGIRENQWEGDYLYAEGTAVVWEKYPGQNRRNSLLAKAAAKTVALNELASVVAGTQIYGSLKVKDMGFDDQTIQQEVRGFLTEVETVSEENFKNEKGEDTEWKVKVRMPKTVALKILQKKQ